MASVSVTPHGLARQPPPLTSPDVDNTNASSSSNMIQTSMAVIMIMGLLNGRQNYAHVYDDGATSTWPSRVDNISHGRYLVESSLNCRTCFGIYFGSSVYFTSVA